ncbi:4-hydroxyphenylpyruvate dioxygenase [Rhodoferax lacus]|uniref:4-hydroxyphenylpyruvate dioxygenase n=1 Tax=Rhodoferax lacus TaxID=2184758 RepID=A0A3E1RD25_9BURK|nr:VOC family protein [Rhodoferax lacus]RFO97259.1 4-hydroxyphenylpyruvate dioxygenase [Rhodoferax lacus]
MSSIISQRESVPELANPLGMDGIEFIEYATSRPQALGQVLESLGFRPVARHRSREVTLYRQGSMNLVVSAPTDDVRRGATASGNPALVAVAFRVRDALKAHTRCLELGAWDVQSHARAMELHIPGIRGPGSSRFYFVDRWKEFSIYDIDFVPIPTVDQHPAALAGMSYFGLVQYIGAGRSVDWMAYYENLFGFTQIPDEQRFGILPKGKLMRSPCGGFLWQLVEPDPGMDDDNAPECLQRIGLGTADVGAAVTALKANGVEFVESRLLHPEDRGALTRTVLGSVSFELVHQGV